MPQYTKIFDAGAAQANVPGLNGAGLGDRRAGEFYAFDDDGRIEFAVNVALASNRPLLVKGPSGHGKSSLAAVVASRLRRRYLEAVVTARTTADDLLWQTDAVRRLSDAQARNLKGNAWYVDPGPLWWAIAPQSARCRGMEPNEGVLSHEDFTAPKPPGWSADDKAWDAIPAVLLVDEIDKADPDVPNALLVPLGSYAFDVAPLERRIALEAPQLTPFVIVTTNDERALPAAFERRCVVLDLPQADARRIAAIIRSHPELATVPAELVDNIARAAEAAKASPAEAVDAVRACVSLGVASDGTRYNDVLKLTLAKSGRR